MAASLRLIELRPSPNNMKVRIALRLKGLDFDTIPVEFGDQDRSEVIRLSGQPLTPVLMDGDHPVWDSAAILRHIDTIAPQEPVLFGPDRDRIHEIERWERWARGEFYENFVIVPSMGFRGEHDADLLAHADATLREHTARIEEALDGKDYLCGAAPTAADLTLAPLCFYAMLPDKFAQTSPIAKFLQDNLKLGDGRDRTRAWVGRVMANWR